MKLYRVQDQVKETVKFAKYYVATYGGDRLLTLIANLDPETAKEEDIVEAHRAIGNALSSIRPACHECGGSPGAMVRFKMNEGDNIHLCPECLDKGLRIIQEGK